MGKVLTQMFYIGVGVLFLSCANSEGKQSGQATKVDLYHPTVHLPAGTKYYYTIHNDMQTDVEVNNKKVRNGSKSEIGLIYESLKDSAGVFLVKITYDQLHITLQNGDNKQEMDAAAGAYSADMVERLLSNIKGASLVLTVNNKGNILHIEGSKEISDRILSALGPQNEMLAGTVRAQLSKLVGDDFIKNNLRQTFSLLPDTAVKVGDSWTGEPIQSADVQLEANTLYKLVSARNGKIQVAVKADIRSMAGSTQLEGIKSMTGTQSGKFETDEATGLLLEADSEATMEGVVQAMAYEVPVEIKMTKKVRAKKI